MTAVWLLSMGRFDTRTANKGDPMPEAVIVATARSPIGRANKGSLNDMRPDDLAAQIVRALMAKVPQVKGSDVEDLMICLLYTSPSPRDRQKSRMPSSA